MNAAMHALALYLDTSGELKGSCLKGLLPK